MCPKNLKEIFEEIQSILTKMSLLEKIETNNEKVTEERKKLVDSEVKKLKEYEKLGLIGE